jgi:hypothetical protein
VKSVYFLFPLTQQRFNLCQASLKNLGPYVRFRYCAAGPRLVVIARRCRGYSLFVTRYSGAALCFKFWVLGFRFTH